MDRHRSESNVSASTDYKWKTRGKVLSDAEELVLKEIARLMDGSRGEITLAEDRLKVMTGLSGPDVRGAIWSLVSKRYISRRGSFCPDRGTMAAYRILKMPRPHERGNVASSFARAPVRTDRNPTPYAH